ncbi:Carboxylesterase family [Musa troglodytarum]|nr:Carboxylesterase family [Musa troglodytarum]
MPILHNYLNSLVARAHVVAVSINYRLAPEHPIPAAYDDSWKALRWVASHANGGPGPDRWLADHADFDRLFLAGDSAGANIAHHMAMRAGAEGLQRGVGVHGVVLVHPYFLGSEPVESAAINQEMTAGLEVLGIGMPDGRSGRRRSDDQPTGGRCAELGRHGPQAGVGVRGGGGRSEGQGKGLLPQAEGEEVGRSGAVRD